MEEASKTVYNKVCRYCGKDYTSTSRNKKYCSQECSDKAQKKNKAIKKKRARKRKEYDENREINQALASAYTLAHKVADLFMIPKECSHDVFQNTSGECTGGMELHHKDGNPFNNSPDNLVYLCKSHHGQVHSDKTRVVMNVVETYKECLDKVGFQEDEEKHVDMIALYMSRVHKD